MGMAALAAAVSIAAPTAAAQQFKGEILHPMMVTRTGPFATASTGVTAGQQDYFTLINLKGGVEGYKIVWEECEFEYKVPRALECYDRYKGSGSSSIPTARRPSSRCRSASPRTRCWRSTSQAAARIPPTARRSRIWRRSWPTSGRRRPRP